VRAHYDAGHARLLALVDDLRDDEFAIRKTNYGDTRTVTEMLHLPAEHVGEHTPQIRAGMGGA
jgi:hypothetical protein